MWYIFQTSVIVGMTWFFNETSPREPGVTKVWASIMCAYLLTRFLSFLINCVRKLINKLARRQIYEIPPPPPPKPSPLLPLVRARRDYVSDRNYLNLSKRKIIAPRLEDD